jgi:3-deoxy-D-manno-octulosonic-acid transferase
VVVIDRIGILRKLYALADVAFVGGSLVKAGGHNPLEPASVAKPVLFGPHTDDFRWICQTLEAAGGAMARVHDAATTRCNRLRLIQTKPTAAVSAVVLTRSLLKTGGPWREPWRSSNLAQTEGIDDPVEKPFSND